MRAAILALAVLVLAIGCCVFDGGEDGHAGFDLCLGMLMTSVTLTLLSRLPLSGLATVDRFAAVLDFSTRVPAPPPKTALS